MMSDGFLLTAAALLVSVIAIAHSWLGERKLAVLTAGSTPRVVRAAWHLTSLAWLGIAAMLGLLAREPMTRMTAGILVAIGGLFLLSAALTLLWLRGRHLSWPLFLLAALAAWTPPIRFYDLAAAVRDLVGLAACAILAAAALVHVYWAAGGARGLGAAIPERNRRAVFAPGRGAAIGVAMALLVVAGLLASRLPLLRAPLPEPACSILCWILAALFVARAVGDFRYVGFFKRVRGSRFAALDSAAYSPLCFLLGLAIADLAVV
jgi:hypothetical protein